MQQREKIPELRGLIVGLFDDVDKRLAGIAVTYFGGDGRQNSLSSAFAILAGMLQAAFHRAQQRLQRLMINLVVGMCF